MVTERALCIALNSVDPKHCKGWSGDLLAREADAEDMTVIASDAKFKKTTVPLLTEEKGGGLVHAPGKGGKDGGQFS